MPDEKQDTVVQQFKKALEAGREAKVNGEISVSVKLYQGGISDGHLTVKREVV